MPDSSNPSSRTDEERDFAAITDDEIWTEAKDRLKISDEAETDNRKRAKHAMLFREGDQWDHTVTTTTSADEPELTINLTDAMVDRVVNNTKQQRPRIKYHPVGEGADIEIAEIFNGCSRHVETRSEASVAYDLAVERAIDAGVGYFRLIAEYEDPRSFRKDLRILPIRNIFTVAMDPNAIMPSGADQNWCLVSMMMPRQEYKIRYPRAPNSNWVGSSRDQMIADWENKESVRLAEYFRIREKPEKLYRIIAADGSEMMKYYSELPRNKNGRIELADVERKFGKVGARIEDERDSVKRQVEWFRLNGEIVIERQQIPGQYIPVFRVQGKCIDIDGKVRRRGMVESMMDPARMVNYGETAKIKRIALTPKAPWTAYEGQLDGHPEWETSNVTAHPVLIHKVVIVETSSGAQILPPPQRLQPATIEAGFAEFIQGMRSNLMAVAGMPNEPGQDQGQGVVVSGRALKRRQWLSDQSHFGYYDNETLAIAQCGRVMAEWFPHYYNEPGRIQRIIGEDSTPEMVTLNETVEEENGVQRVKNDLSVGRYDVVMDTGPGYETKREEGAENLIDLMKVGPLAELIAKQGADLVFRSIDHPYMQELADRLMSSNPEALEKLMQGLSSRARSIVQALFNQVQALTQQNQTLQQDLKAGITKAHLAATVKAHDTEVRAQTELKRAGMEDATWQHDISMREHGKLASEEIKGFVQLLLQNKEHFMRALEMVAGQQESALDREQAAAQPQNANGSGQ